MVFDDIAQHTHSHHNKTDTLAGPATDQSPSRGMGRGKNTGAMVPRPRAPCAAIGQLLMCMVMAAAAMGEGAASGGVEKPGAEGQQAPTEQPATPHGQPSAGAGTGTPAQGRAGAGGEGGVRNAGGAGVAAAAAQAAVTHIHVCRAGDLFPARTTGEGADFSAAVALSPMHRCRNIFLRGAPVGDVGLSHLAVHLAAAKDVRLNKVHLADTGAGPSGGTALARALAAGATVEALWLSGNVLADEGMHALASAFASRGAGLGLAHLFLDRCRLGALGEGASAALLAALAGVGTLQTLSLVDNGLGASAPLLHAIPAGLHSLELGGNAIGNAGAACMHLSPDTPSRAMQLLPVALPWAPRCPARGLCSSTRPRLTSAGSARPHARG